MGPDSTLALARWLGRSQRLSWPAQLGVGFVTAACGVGIRVALNPWLDSAIPWVSFFAAVLLAALCAGATAGVVSLMVCAVVGVQLWGSGDGWRPASVVAFVANAGLLVAVGSVLRHALLGFASENAAARAVADRLEERRRELAQRVDDLTALHRFGTQIAASSDRNGLLRILLEAAVSLQGATRGFIELVDANGDRLCPGAQVGHDAPTLQRLARMRVAEGEGACGTCAARRERVIIEDTESDPLFDGYREEARAAGVRAVWSTPLLTHGGVLVGVLSTHFAEPRRPTEREVQLVEVYARLGADAIESATLYEREARARMDAERALEGLREQHRRKDEFLAMLGHELRNPLAPIRLVIDSLKLRQVQTLSDRELRILDRQATALTRMVDDLLDVARVTQGRIELQLEPVAVSAWVSRAAELVAHLMSERRHQLTVKTLPDAMFVNGDPVRLEQVLVNLLANAAKYTAPGGHIELRVERIGQLVRIRVIDDGIGIPVADIESMFELFHQGSRQLDRQGGGLGIGLTVAKRLVEMHHGHVSAISAGSGHGSEFCVELPLLDLVPSYAAASREGARSQRLRVLVVDDNPDAAETLASLVHSMGHATAVANGGLAALAAATELDPDVVFLDLGMPDVDGYKVQRRLATSHPRAKIIAVTGYSQPSDRARTSEAGFAHHLVKPVRLDQLLEVLSGTAAPIEARAFASNS